MKIVQLCPYAMERPGGVQRHVRDLSAWLTAQGHQVRIVAPPLPGRRPRQDGALTELGRARSIGMHGTAFELSLASPGHVRRLARELADWGADLVHMHTPWTPALVWQVWRALRLPTVTTIHATLPKAEGAGLMDRYIRRAARHFMTHSAAVIVPSQAPLAMLQRLDPQIQPHILPPAVDLSPWRAACVPRDPDRPLSLAFLGRLEARKGVDILLKAWPAITAALPTAILTIAGDGPLRSDVMSVSGPNMIYAGRPDDDQAQQILAATDLFLAPAPYGESYGLVLAEAMAAGAVPIAAANVGYQAVIPDPTLLVPPGDGDALAQKTIALGRDAPGLIRLRKRTMTCANDTDIVQLGPQYESLFQTVLDGWNSAGSCPDTGKPH